MLVLEEGLQGGPVAGDNMEMLLDELTLLDMVRPTAMYKVPPRLPIGVDLAAETGVTTHNGKVTATRGVVSDVPPTYVRMVASLEPRVSNSVGSNRDASK